MIALSRKAAIGDAFGRAAATYDQFAGVQRRAANGLAQRIAGLPLPAAPSILEIGCGTGLLTAALQHLLPDATRLITDLSPAMVRHCRAHNPGAPDQFLALDGEIPPFAGPEFDLICASLAFQWFDDAATALPRLHALLRPGGWLAFATLGPATLTEWRDAHVAENLRPPTPAFRAPAALAAAWPHSNGADPLIERRIVAVAHASGRAFLASLRGIGADIPRPGHQPLRPGELRRVLARFEQDYLARCSYEIVSLCLRHTGPSPR
jgi:malonyl-CoA O-methyltransferase